MCPAEQDAPAPVSSPASAGAGDAAAAQSARRPSPPAVRMAWSHLLFMHWPVDSALLSSLLPEGVEVETFEGSAWIGVIPFTMPHIGAARLPRALAMRRVHEINVRTYVRAGGESGVWFFSLDCASRLAVAGARACFRLPYHRAEIDLRRADRLIRYTSRRRAGPPALFDATWRVGDPLTRSEPGELAHFLTERYQLFTTRAGALHRSRIAHERWTLREASLERGEWRSTMIESLGLPEPADPPHLMAGARLDPVLAWPLERL